MQADIREEIACRLFGSTVSVEVPDSLAGRVRSALGRLSALPDVGSVAGDVHPDSNPASCRASIHLAPSPPGWRVEIAGRRSSATDEEAAVVHLQEMLLERAASRAGQYLLVRGSLVARGSQSVLIVGDRGSTHALAGVALIALGFRLVSVGVAAFECRSLLPLPLSLAFALKPEEQQALTTAGIELAEQLESLSGQLFCPRSVGKALEPTHVLFPETHVGSLSLVRPVAAAAARSRLSHAILAAPADVSPFAAVASLLRHTRGIQLTLGDVEQALGQLSRLLPRWSMD